MGKKMAGTNEFAFFRCKSMRTGGGGVQNQAEKNSKNAFRPVPVQKFTFPAENYWGINCVILAGPMVSFLQRLLKGRQPTPKSHAPKEKQIAQAVCANCAASFLLALQRTGGTVCTNCSQIVCANCVFVWVCVCFFLLGGLPSLQLRLYMKFLGEDAPRVFFQGRLPKICHQNP